MEQFEKEYVIKCSPRVLFNYIATDGGLKQWFADDVKEKNNVYHFKIGDEDRQAIIEDIKENQMIKFKWLNEPEETFLQFVIQRDELTDDVSLIVTDFVMPENKDEMIEIWNNLIHRLMAKMGSDNM